MAVRAVVLVCLILIVLPVFSDGPPGAKNADPNPEFFFTRVMYTDTRGRGPRIGMPSTDFEHGHSLGDRLARSYGA